MSIEEHKAGKAISVWMCSGCNVPGVGRLYLQLHCSGGLGGLGHCEAEVELVEPEGWLLLPEECFCQACQEKQTCSK